MRKLQAVALAMAFVAVSSACRSHRATIYAGVDPQTHPTKADSVFLKLPDDASIRERQAGAKLRERLGANEFTLANDAEAAQWILTLSLDRETYVSGFRSGGASFPIGDTGIAINRQNTAVQRQTDVTLYLWLFRATDGSLPEPPLYWEGAATATDAVYRQYPNALIDHLLACFGQDAFRQVRLKSEPVQQRVSR